MGRWFRMFLKQNDNEKISEHIFRTRMLMSVFCIFACLTAMFSSAYAWFIADISSEQNKVSTAHYSLEITAGDGSAAIDESYGVHTYLTDLSYKDEHYYTLTAVGSASKGYCEILISDGQDGTKGVEKYRTSTIEQGESLEVCIRAAAGSKIEFIPVWGSYQTAKRFSLRKSNVFSIDHSSTPYIKYKVLPNVTLEDLADYYGVDAEDICIYNDITKLKVGDVIRIPYVDDKDIEPYRLEVPQKNTSSNAVKKSETDSKLENDMIQETIGKATDSNASRKQ